MPTLHKWHLILTTGESTQLDGIANAECNEDNHLTFTNEAGEVVCFVNRSLLVLAKRIELSGGKR